MKDKDRIALQKMDKYVHEILSYTNGMDFNGFLEDNKTINASAFLIGQIGELVGEISDETQENCPDIPWRNIKGMRNRIIHDYEDIDFTVLWGTITENLLDLSNNIQKILAQSQGNL